ncbi:MAG: signal recognition particle-docking protein FtsY [Candidatus Caldatribacteriaceae bacterium]
MSGAFFKKWLQNIGKMRDEVRERFAQLWSRKEVKEEEWEELEEMLIQADIGPSLAMELVEEFRGFRENSRGEEDWQSWLYRKLLAFLEGNDSRLFPHASLPGLRVILLSGINGVGKTTTAGKLAYLLTEQGEKVVLVGADTFRAAASEQLEIWARRAHCRYFRGSSGADPGAVVFDSISSARNSGDSVVIVDTAGRSHVNKNLLAELEKVVRVTKKLVEPPQLESLVVIDALTGQNAFSQVESIAKVADLTGIILTKWDSQAKGGIIFRVAKEFALPVKYVGVGEGIEDLVPFEAEEFVKAVVY